MKRHSRMPSIPPLAFGLTCHIEFYSAILKLYASNNYKIIRPAGLYGSDVQSYYPAMLDCFHCDIVKIQLFRTIKRDGLSKPNLWKKREAKEDE